MAGDLSMLDRLCRDLIGRQVSRIVYTPYYTEAMTIHVGELTDYTDAHKLRNAHKRGYSVDMHYEYRIHSQGPIAVMSHADRRIMWSTDDPILGGMFDYEDENNQVQSLLSRWLVGVQIIDVEVSTSTICLVIANGMSVSFYPVALPNAHVPLNKNFDPIYSDEELTIHPFTILNDHGRHQRVSVEKGVIEHRWTVITDFMPDPDELNTTIHLPSFLMRERESDSE